MSVCKNNLLNQVSVRNFLWYNFKINDGDDKCDQCAQETEDSMVLFKVTFHKLIVAQKSKNILLSQSASVWLRITGSIVVGSYLFIASSGG